MKSKELKTYYGEYIFECNISTPYPLVGDSKGSSLVTDTPLRALTRRNYYLRPLVWEKSKKLK